MLAFAAGSTATAELCRSRWSAASPRATCGGDVARSRVLVTGFDAPGSATFRCPCRVANGKCPHVYAALLAVDELLDEVAAMGAEEAILGNSRSLLQDLTRADLELLLA